MTVAKLIGSDHGQGVHGALGTGFGLDEALRDPSLGRSAPAYSVPTRRPAPARDPIVDPFRHDGEP